MSQALLNFTTKEEIEALEKELLMVQNCDIPVQHNFADGIYTRQITMPKGCFAIGHEHSKDCLNVVISGSASVVIDGQVKVITGPCVFVSPAGQRKVGYVHDDLTWMTVHATKETCLDKLEKELLVKSEAFIKHENAIDFQAAIAELGFTADQVLQISTNESDFDPAPMDGIEIKQSGQAGNGLFATRNFEANEIIGIARYDATRTLAGRYTNHAKYPNAKMELDDSGVILLVTIDPLKIGDEITVDYRQAFSVSRILNQTQLTH